MTEATLQTKVMQWLKKEGLWVDKSPSPWDKSGIVDILGCWHGLFVAIELKAPGKYNDVHEGLSAEQMQFLSAVKENGGIAVVADSLQTVQLCLRKKKGVASIDCRKSGNFSDEVAAAVRQMESWIKRQKRSRQQRTKHLRGAN